MRIAIVGAGGQLATALESRLEADLLLLRHADFEITDAAQVDAALRAARPDCVINTAAYNFVDRAEDEPATAYAVNGLGPRNLAAWCGKAGVPLVHISTDYVFGAERPQWAPWLETDVPSPAGAYAVSKLAGEYFVQANAPRHFIVRTCGLYGPASTEGKGNFVKTMLRLAKSGKQLTIVNDQHCTPTFAPDLAAAIAHLIETEAYGLYHATNAGGTTWYEFARAIFRLAAIDIAVRPITSAQYPQKAPRPAYSVLDSGKLAATTGIAMPAWDDALGRYLIYP